MKTKEGSKSEMMRDSDFRQELKSVLLIDSNVKSVRQRMETTLSNIQYQKGVMMWDDEEKIEHCIEILKILEYETTPVYEDQCWDCKEDIQYTDLHPFCPECNQHQ
ncbi:MAG: hypothetical protein GY760_22420 [Deltaproteobacteria bacterium]|jgi:Zn finger protein HypA/HybF involved in hydrogenase expression|nr:hypothetical protein [Deltaproteobacteria bacterium]